MTDHYEMPHARADECPHAGVGKACRPCRDRFERTPITPDERANVLALADNLDTYPEAEAADTLRRLLDALTAVEAEVARLTPPCDGGCSYNDGPAEDCSAHGRPVAEVWGIVTVAQRQRDEARAEVARLREQAAPVRPDRETIADVLIECGTSCGRADVDHEDGPCPACVERARGDAHAVLLEWPGESRATVQAEALRDAAAAAVAQDNTQGDWWDDDQQTYGTPVEWLRARADRLDPREADR